MRILFFIMLYISLVFVLHAENEPNVIPHNDPSVFSSSAYALKGIASYYGEKFHNKRTANGELFDMHALTAAHRTLPFNTKVEIINANNGKTIQVRINDRGPFIKDRVIDLSYKAASSLGMIGTGVAPVYIKILNLGEDNSATSQASSTQSVHIQVASYANKQNAERTHTYLVSEGFSSNIEATGKFYRIIIPYVEDNIQIQAIQQKLALLGFTNTLVRR